MAPWGDLDERLLGCFVREVDYAELQTNGPGAIVTAKSGKDPDGAGESQLQCFGALARL